MTGYSNQESRQLMCGQLHGLKRALTASQDGLTDLSVLFTNPIRSRGVTDCHGVLLWSTDSNIVHGSVRVLFHEMGAISARLYNTSLPMSDIKIIAFRTISSYINSLLPFPIDCASLHVRV